MNHYPLFLKLQGRKVAFFGGGAVARRKIKTLLRAGARVECASLDHSKGLRALSRRHPRLRLVRQGNANALLRQAALAFVATSDPKFNRKVAVLARRRRIPVNVADHPGLSDFFVPAFFKKGKLELAISTGGASPLLARKFREELSRKIRPEAVRLLNRMRASRSLAFLTLDSPRERKAFLERKIAKNFHFL